MFFIGVNANWLQPHELLVVRTLEWQWSSDLEVASAALAAEGSLYDHVLVFLSAINTPSLAWPFYWAVCSVVRLPVISIVCFICS